MSAATVAVSPWFQQWPQLGSDEQFARMRRLFDESGYTVEGICRRFGVTELSGYCEPPAGGRPMQDWLDALIALFFDCGFVEESKLAAILPDGSIALMDALGLLAREPAPPGTVFVTAAILPVFGVLTACDRSGSPDGSPCLYPEDVVYPPVFHTTQKFRAELPDSPCDAMLDLGTGTGIAALLSARHAKHVWATDITARAVRFAEFNRRLAALDNITVVEGDLYGPVQDLTFDRIVMHPPYVPTILRDTRLAFADGGDDGEEIVRRAVQGLPQVLRPGGRLYSLQWATDRKDEPFEQRVRQWLGPQEADFDVMIAVHSQQSIVEFLSDFNRGGHILDRTRAWVELWAATKTQNMVYSTTLIERHDRARDRVTRRVHAAEGYTVHELESLLAWMQRVSAPDHVEMLLNCRPAAVPNHELRETRRLYDGRFQPQEFRIEIPGPFATSLRCEEWLTQVLPQCNGTKTWREHFDHARNSGLIRPEVPADAFAGLLGMLVAIGAVKVS